eukprot:jgi/Botrbrau1/8749/Bobra.0090s0023.1
MHCSEAAVLSVEAGMRARSTADRATKHCISLPHHPCNPLPHAFQGMLLKLYCSQAVTCTVRCSSRTALPKPRLQQSAALRLTRQASANIAPPAAVPPLVAGAERR